MTVVINLRHTEQASVKATHTCAHREIGDVLIAKGLLVGDTLCKEAESRATYYSYRWAVSSPAQ